MKTLFHPKALILFVGFACAQVPAVFGEAGEDELELREAKAALDTASLKLATLEAKVAKLVAQNEALTLALAEANLEAGKGRSDAELASKTLEALGVDLLSGTEGVSGRLIKAANDLRIAKNDNSKLRASLVGLSEAALSHLGSDVEPVDASTGLLRSAVDSANRVLEAGIGSSGITTLGGESRMTKVVGLKPALGLLIVNAGDDAGLHEGAPLRIYRAGKAVAEALVVEVRSRVSGAIVTENFNTGDVAIGDVARLNLVNSFKN